ncbi:unnamed protein product [Owenia fusiformis]|uniref:Uncharacterized protein n=1 Tax=Owenia fusiformis TaxID=6347 RepID=A0A8S4Q5S7_OWEFU|nr:unnamed protein product [Owenia fusiformis]
MSRRGGGANMLAAAGGIKKASIERRRGAAKDGVPKEGDVFYRIVKSYPRIPEIPEETSCNIAKPIEFTPGSEKYRQLAASPGGRRASILSDKSREDMTTPIFEDHRYELVWMMSTSSIILTRTHISCVQTEPMTRVFSFIDDK